jgi:hypothetical protein
MNPIKLDRFSGIIPRIPDALLPPNNASGAQNCDFAYGELRSSKLDFLIRTMANAVGSGYTDNGLVFYTWPDDVNALRSPLANDPYNRLYFTTPQDFRVTSRDGMRANGGEPASSYRVGVPRPQLAPVLSVSTVSPLVGNTLTATFHYESGGIKYQEQVLTLTTVSALEKWTFTPPAKAYTVPVRDPDTKEYPPPRVAETPAQAVPVIRLTAKRAVDNSVALDLYSDNSTLNTESAWRLAISKTGSANDYTVVLSNSNNEADKDTRSYVYTYANTWNEEGPASPPATITIPLLLDVAVQVTRDSQTADYAPIKEIRIYRTPSGSDVADYFYVGAIPVLSQNGTQFQFNDDVTAAGLNEPLSSSNAYPPNPALVGLTALPNGILMAWRGNELHFSDAYKPWSWPPDYVLTFGDANIVGAIAAGAGALITTTGKPCRISGVSPDAMTQSGLNVLQAGVSKWAIADLGGVIVYASHDGLVAFDGGQPNLSLSERYFTRDTWRARYGHALNSMRFAVWDGRLIVYSSTNAFTAFLLGLDESQGAMTELPGLLANCSFISPLIDQCYIARGNGLFQFYGGDEAVCTWTSREFVLPRPLNYAIVQIVCSGLWTVKVFADGVLRHTQANLSGSITFRLPGGYQASRWKITLQGTGTVRELRIAETTRELKEI